MKDIKDKLIELSNLLRIRDNRAFNFFNQLVISIDDNPKEVIEKILKSYSITQYADFNYEEEKLLNDIWNLADQYRGII